MKKMKKMMMMIMMMKWEGDAHQSNLKSPKFANIHRYKPNKLLHGWSGKVRSLSEPGLQQEVV